MRSRGYLRKFSRRRCARVVSSGNCPMLPAQLRQCFGRWLRTALGRDAFPEEIGLCWVRVRTSFCSSAYCHWHVGPSRHWERVAVWPTTRRLEGAPSGVRHWVGATSVTSCAARRSVRRFWPPELSCRHGSWRIGTSCPPAAARRHIADSGVGTRRLLGPVRWPARFSGTPA